MAIQDFWTVYREAVGRLMRPIEASDGIDPARLTKAEEAHKIRLPGLLKEFYTTCGNMDEINRAYNFLVNPEDFKIHTGTLIIYHENQDVVWWGIKTTDLRKEDPPIYQRANVQHGSWRLDYPNLSDFLLAMFYWQLVNGGMSHTDIADIDDRQLDLIRQAWPKVEITENGSELEIYSREGQVLCVVRSPGNLELVAGATSQQELDDAGAIIGVDWEY